MSDIAFNRNPFSGGREEAAASLAPAPAAPAAPTAPKAYMDYNAAALQAAASPEALRGAKGYTDYNALAKELGGSLASARQANLDAFSYMTPVSDLEYGVIRNRLLEVKNNGGDWQGEAYKLATAVELSRFMGRSMESVMENFDASVKAWTGADFSPTKTNFLAVMDSFKVGEINVEMGKTARAWMESGGTDAALEKKLDDLNTQLARYQDNTPRPWVIRALEAGAESAPFTVRAAAAGLAGAGLVALTGGALAPGVFAAVKAGASMLGSFAESSATMAGLEYYEMRKAGIAHETAQASAELSGALQGAVESLLGNVPGLAGMAGAGASLANKATARLAMKGGFGAVARAAIEYGGEAVEEGIEEAVQQVISESIQNDAKADYGIEVSDAKAIAKNAWEAAKGGFTASLAMGLPASVVSGMKSAKSAKALKEYATSVDRDTFIENASKWSEIEALPEAQRKDLLNKVWEQAQAKAKEEREAAPTGEAKPFKRTEAGTLYTEEKTVASAEEGKVEAILKVGDAESKERLGYLKYSITDEGITIENAPFKKGYEAVREEAIQELAAKYPGLPITASEAAPDATRAAVDRLAAANPKGTGANWFAEGEDENTARARARLRLVIADKMPKVSPVQREAAILLHEFRANAQGVPFAEYLQNEFSPEIIGDKGPRVSAAQGQRAGILFTKDGQELRIGEFVRDAKALVMVTEKSDFVSFVHESGHLFRKQLIGTDLGTRLEEAYGIAGGTWTREHEERFTDDLVKYLSYGEAKDERLRGVFAKIAEWITRLWNRVLNQADVDPRVRAVMDELFASEKSPLQEAARTSVVAEDGEAQADAKAVQPEGSGEVLFQPAEPTDSAAFKAWFGDSKVVDENGKPLVVYHGTGSRFTKFDKKKSTQGIFWATSDKSAIESGNVGAQGKGVILSLYASIKNPAGWAEYDKYSIDELERMGFDGAILPNGDGTITMFVLEPTQFKSVNNRGTFDPNDPRILYQYVGERANLGDAERQNLAVAREMDAAGKDAETVRLATGWFKGKYDGKWRLEISDKAVVHVYEDRIIPGKAVPLAEVLQYPALYAKYPDLKDIPVSTLPEHTTADSVAAIGEGKSGEKYLLVTPERAGNQWELSKIVLHEVQHLIQEREGFARGSSPFEFEYDDRKVQAYRYYRDASVLQTMKARTGSVEEAVKQFKTRLGRDPEPGASTILDDYTKEDLVQLAEDSRPRTLMEQYTNTAGEIEARDIEARMGLSPEQRRATAPYSSENIAAEDAVVLFQTADPPDSPEFKAWFGKSQVVDDNGKPRVMYRGSEHPNAEPVNGNLVFLSPNRDFAENYGRGNVFALLVKAERIFDAAGADHALWKKFAEETNQPGYATKGTPLGALPFWTVQQSLVKWLDKNGIDYDGIYFAENDGSYSLAVKDIRQVKAIANTKPTDDPRILFQLDEDAIDAEAAEYASWEDWKSYVEEFAIPAFGEDARAPEGLTAEAADAWYKTRWEAARAKVEEQAAAARTAERREARRGEFAARMAQKGGVESLLSAIWEAQVRAFDPVAAMDAEEQAEIEKAHDWKAELARRLADHPLVLLAAQSVGQGKKLSPSTRKAILTYIRNNEVEFAALQAELTGDLDLAQYAEASRAKLQEIPDPKLDRYADLSIAERTALLNRITDQEVRGKLKSGEYDDPYLADYVRRLEADKKALTKTAKDAAEEIEKLGGKLEAEEDFARKMRDRAREFERQEGWAEKELEKSQGKRQALEAARAAYAEALASARDESKLSVRIAKEALLDALKDARREAALQARMVAAEIRATHKLRAQRDTLRRAILKKPSKNIIWEKRQQIVTIQDYLRSKKWEYVEDEEPELDGTKRRKRAYDTVIGEDGKVHKVPRYTTTAVENLKAGLSLLLRESPQLGKYLTEDMVDRINDKPVSAWTVAELKDLKAIIDRLAKEGRLAFQDKQAREEMERADARHDTNQTVRKSRFFKEPFGHGSEEQKALMKSMEKRSVLDLPFLNMARFSETYMDNGKRGANHALLVAEERTHYAAKVKEADRRLQKVFTRMKELGLGEKDFRAKVTLPGIGPGKTDYTITKGDLMAVRLALRDPDARMAFIFGNLFSEEERRSTDPTILKTLGDAKLEKVRDAVEADLTPEMKELADMIGDDFDREFDRLNKVVIDLTNQEMKKVAHYFPIHREGAYFDKFNDSIIEELKAKYGMTNLPDSGFTLERIKIGANHQTPIKLDLFGTWQKAVDRQEHLVAYGAYVKKLNAVYKSRKGGSVREAIIQAFGRSGMDYVDQYISEIANPHEFKGPEEGDRAVRLLRGNMAVGFLAYRWTSVVKQIITSPLPYMAYAPKGMSAAAFECMKSGHPLKWLAEIEGMSEMLKHRTADQIFETIRNMDKEGFEGIVKKIGNTGMKGLEMADRFSVAIGWKGVYDEARAKGKTHEEAVVQADDITLKTQPSARGVDLAPIFRGNNEWKRLLLQFGSALNVIYQNIRYDIPQAARDKEYGRAVGIATSYAVAGILLGAFTKARGKDTPDDDEAWYRDWIFYSMTQFTDSVPLIGSEVTGFMKRWIAGDKRRFGDSDLLPAVEALFSGVDNLFEGDILAAAEEVGTGLGLGIGLPTLALKEYIEFLISLIGGEGDIE